jgi:hypothetical protein
MKMQPRTRTGIALIAAYAVALQALLLAVMASSAGVASATGIAALPLCASTSNHSTPSGHGQDCLDACLTACCCGAPLMPAAPRALYSAPKPLQALAVALNVGTPVLIRAAKAHRSRAPPAA